MKTIGIKGATLLMLLGAVAGSLAVTNASAMSKSAKQYLTSAKKADQKSSKTSKKIDKAFDKVGMRNLSALMADGSNGVVPGSPETNIFYTTKKVSLSNGTSKKVTLGKGSVVSGTVYQKGTFTVSSLNLSKKNQKKVFKGLSTKYPGSGLSTVNGTPLTKYTKNTAFAHNGVRNLPDLQQKGLQSYFDTDKANNPFITVTSDNYLNYYTTSYKKGNTANYSKISQSVKIKKFTRGSSNYTYYLAKPLKGFGTKKVKVGKKTLYKLKMSLGHVFMAADNFNHDADTFRITVNVGNKQFYVTLGDVAESYAYALQGHNYGSFSTSEAKSYIESLQ
ncbi:hypothetical protein [Levilactobacillus suantsaiihabitans]|uniref:Surface layer protein A domain-containing protein n=1 Tax=Levilactobacillus suantsaiihabitans TaxID=2487722 RepID=A0A4Z0J9R2_9LACO|nr:hypothetical protein [Levilactobacillus suantsaiihabitans]TGD18488.1 hypothetical protein EGT51_08395 [Levilactobacillus suantsaiihabitans]